MTIVGHIVRWLKYSLAFYPKWLKSILAFTKAFQKAEGLTQDGKYGDKTHAALMEALADKEDGTEPPEAEAEPPTPRESRVVLVSRNGRVNIRTGNGTNYARITSASDGASFVHVATAGNGWHAVVVGSRVGWVSGEFSKVESV